MTNLVAFFPKTGLVPSSASLAPAPVVEAPAVVQQVTVDVVQSRTDLTKAQEMWDWSDLRDYVCAEIIARFGAFPRNSKKEFGIFSRYLKEHGQDGIRVARTAFDVYDGWWMNSPISINRFAKGSDPYFVTPILERLQDTSQ